jgi:hypothetical protein
MRPFGQGLDDERFAAGVDPMPGAIVNRNVDVADARHDIERGDAVNRHNSQILGTVRDHDESASQGFFKWGRHDQSRGSLPNLRCDCRRLEIFG